jgi:hypothetical protein
MTGAIRTVTYGRMAPTRSYQRKPCIDESLLSNRGRDIRGNISMARGLRIVHAQQSVWEW